MKNKTIQYYDEQAEEFYIGTVTADMKDLQNRFLSYLPQHGKILDAGCGSGRDSKCFLEAGFQVDAFDASEQLCKLATELISQHVRHMYFENIDYENEYDGVWASASLLHVSKSELPNILVRMHRSLKKHGILYASFKEGCKENEKGERFFSDYSREEICEVFEEKGLFDTIECFTTSDVRENRNNELWVNIIVRKLNSSVK